MSNKTIAKFFLFVIPTAFIWLTVTSCSFLLTEGRRPIPGELYSSPNVIGTIRNRDVDESSGIAVSKCQDGVFWTHNDSGDDAYIYAFDRTGENLGTWKVQNAENRDWEDIASIRDESGKCFLYIGEIGDNELLWPEHLVYRVEEPIIIPEAKGSRRKNAMISAPAESLRYRYPDNDHDAETMMVHPVTRDIYVITKKISGPAGVYRLKPLFNTGDIQTAVKVAKISVPAVPNGLLTGGDISPDAKRVVVCDYGRAYEFTLDGAAADFDSVWTTNPVPIDVGKRHAGEAVGYSADGNSIFTTSEGRKSPIIEIRRVK